MSRKPLRNLSPERINSLFSDLDLDAPEVLPAAPTTQAGWTWECDESWLYTTISPEVENILGILPEAFINQSITEYRLHPTFDKPA